MSNIDLTALITAQTKRETQRARTLENLATLRWQHETAGLTLSDGRHVATTRDSQSQIANAATGVRAGLISEPMPWKTLQGWTEFTPEALLTMASEVSTHVRACFLAERKVADRLETMEDPANLDLTTAFPEALAGDA